MLKVGIQQNENIIMTYYFIDLLAIYSTIVKPFKV